VLLKIATDLSCIGITIFLLYIIAGHGNLEGGHRKLPSDMKLLVL
jgi:hypothetical protein